MVGTVDAQMEKNARNAGGHVSELSVIGGESGAGLE